MARERGRGVAAVRLLAALAALVAMGCRRGGDVVPDSSLATDQPITGRVLEVRMLADASGDRFEPADVHIRPGDGVRWVGVSGGPHQLYFVIDSIPPRRAAHVWANMPGGEAMLTGPRVANGSTYTVSFGGAARGAYVYRCLTHRSAAGVSSRVTVQ